MKSHQLAITLTKGYAKEYRDRDLFNSIYFSKLSMSHEEEGYIPILYNFQLDHEKVSSDLPKTMMMTFYYPEVKRMSNLNGIIIIGGEPDIYQAYHTTKMITPYLESLTLNKHNIDHKETIATLDETLQQLAHPTQVRGIVDIMSRSTGKSGENLESFFPILGDEEYQDQRLSLPNDFKVDAVFMLGIEEEFFNSTSIGNGILSLKMYGTNSNTIDPSLAFPLIFKWQPVYNDILNQLSKREEFLPLHYKGNLIPSVVIFQQQESKDITALISAIHKYEGKLYYHVAVANSGKDNGQPLSLLQSALGREKFGKKAWIEKLDNLKFIPEDSIKHQEYGEDLISSQLTPVVEETDLTTDGLFDLGKLRSVQLNKETN